MERERPALIEGGRKQKRNRMPQSKTERSSEGSALKVKAAPATRDAVQIWPLAISFIYQDIFFETAVEAAEVDELGEVAFEGWVGGCDVEGIGEDEAATRHEMADGGGEEVLDE